MAVHIDKGSALSNLSLTPLIDIVFLLLIFLLVATEFAEEEHDMKVKVPEASEAKPLTSQPQEITINVRNLTKRERTAGVRDREQPRYYVTGKVLNLAQRSGRTGDAIGSTSSRQSMRVTRPISGTKAPPS